MASVLIAGGEDDKIDIFISPADGAAQSVTIGSDVTSLDISPDGARLALTCGSNNTIRIFSTDGFAEVAGPTFTSNANACRWSPDGQYLAVVGNASPRVWVFETATWAQVSSIIEAPSWYGNDCAWSPDGSLLIVAHDNAPGVCVYDTATWAKTATQPASVATGRGVDVAPDGQIYIAASGSLWFIDPATMGFVDSVAHNCYKVRLSPDASKLALAHTSGIRIIDTGTRAGIATTAPEMSTGWYKCIAWSPDGATIAAGTSDGKLRIFAVDGWTLSHSIDISTTDIDAVMYTADLALPSRDFLTYDSEGNPAAAHLKLLDPASMKVVGSLLSAPDGTATATFIDERKLVATLWDARPSVQEFSFVPFTITASPTDPAIEMYLGYAGDLATMSGRVTVSTGGPADEVVIRAWASRKLVARVYPDSSGDWTAQVPPGEYDVTYIKAGCAPVVHGPYTVAAT